MPGGDGYPADGERRVRATGHRWDVFRQLVFATYGDTCWVCGHGGARTVDHVQSLTEHPELMYVLSNCKPAHGSPYPCATCTAMAGRPVFCNSIKGGYSVERARKIIAERTGSPVRQAESPGEAPDNGREF